MNGSFECRRVGAASYQAPSDVENHTFLVRPLIENEREDLRRCIRGGPTETEPPEVGGGLGGMKEQSERDGSTRSRQGGKKQNEMIPIVLERGTELA